MIETLIQWVQQYAATLLEWLVDIFLRCLDIDLGAYVESFPFLSEAYSIFQYAGTALSLVIGALGLYSFYTLKGSDLKIQDRPIDIYFKTALAVGCIYYGGYVLQYLVKVASCSFGVFLKLDVANTDEVRPLFDQIFSGESIAKSIGEILAIDISGLDVPLTLLSVILLFVVGFNLLKLVIEVAERWLMVGVLFFTAPLVYSTIPSKSTSNLFRNWFRMFVGSLIMMSLSVFFMKLTLSGLFNVEIGAKYFLQMILVIASTKIAQRTDTYLTQIGLSVPITGGNLFDDIAAVGMAVKSMLSPTVKSGKGSASSGKGDSRAGGLLGGSINGIRAAKQSFADGSTGKVAFSAGKNAFINTMKRTGTIGSFAGGIEAKNMAKTAGLSKSQTAAAFAGGSIRGLAEGLSARTAQAIAPGTMNAHRNSLARQAEIAAVTSQEMKKASQSELQRAHEAAISKHQANISKPNMMPMPNYLISEVSQDGFKGFSAATAAINQSNYGVADIGQSAFRMDPYKLDQGSHDLDLSANAKAGNSFLVSYKDQNGALSYRIDTDERSAARIFQNENGRDKTLVSESDIPETDAFRPLAIKTLSRENDKFAADHETLPEEKFNKIWGSSIHDKCVELRNMDINALDTVNKDYVDTLRNSAEHASPITAAMYFMDNDKEIVDDQLINKPLFENAFLPICSVAGDEGFYNIHTSALPDAQYEDGTRTEGGMIVEASYTDSMDKEATAHIYDLVAYTSPAMSDEMRDSLIPLQLADGRIVYTDVVIDGAEKYVMDRSMSGSQSEFKEKYKDNIEKVDAEKVKQNAERKVGR